MLYRNPFNLNHQFYQRRGKCYIRNGNQRMYERKSNIVSNLNVLKEQLSKDHYDTLITMTFNTIEKHFTKRKEHLISKCNSLINTTESK